MTAPVTSITLKEWDSRFPEPGTGLHGRFLDSPGERAVAQALTNSSLLGLTELRTGLKVQSFSHVGKVRLGNLEITILPKLEHATLLNLLRYAFGFRRLKLLSEASHWTESGGFADLLVHQLNAEVAELVARGLHRNYVGIDAELASPRGRIAVQRIARNGGMPAAALPCVHFPRIEDTLLNRGLLAGLHLAARAATDLQLRRDTRRLASLFEEDVSAIVLTDAVLQQVANRLNRLTRAYEPALNIIRLLCEAQGVSFTGTTSSRLPGFLFDMNRFFQALVSRYLNDHLEGYQVHDEFGLRGMLRFDPSHNPRNRKAPTPRPDFVVMRGSQAIAVLDAKYRDLWLNSLPRDMLYQLAFYATTQRRAVATILYPTLDTTAQEARINVHEPLYSREVAQVRLRPVILPALESLILQATSAAGQRRKNAYARWLAFGAEHADN